MFATCTGKRLRLARLCRPADGHFLFVPLDHSVSDGPITEGNGLGSLVRSLVAGGTDAIVVHKGRVGLIDPLLLRECGLVVQLSASTRYAPDPDAKVLVSDVEEAVSLGADAVSVHVNIGSATEASQLADLGRVARACEQWGVPLLAMMYPRGPQIGDPHAVGLLAHAANIAADLGADLVKTPSTAPIEGMTEVVERSPIPVLMAGGGADDGDLGVFARRAMATGCAGLCVGRRVFQHSSPTEAAGILANVVHGFFVEPEFSPELARVVAGTL